MQRGMKVGIIFSLSVLAFSRLVWNAVLGYCGLQYHCQNWDGEVLQEALHRFNGSSLAARLGKFCYPSIAFGRSGINVFLRIRTGRTRSTCHSGSGEIHMC